MWWWLVSLFYIKTIILIINHNFWMKVNFVFFKGRWISSSELTSWTLVRFFSRVYANVPCDVPFIWCTMVTIRARIKTNSSVDSKMTPHRGFLVSSVLTERTCMFFVRLWSKLLLIWTIMMNCIWVQPFSIALKFEKKNI